jgi:hypothetical protein
LTNVTPCNQRAIGSDHLRIFRFLPLLGRWDVPRLVADSGCPGSKVAPPLLARRSLFVLFVSFCSRSVCTGQDKPRDSVNELDFVKVEQKPQRHVEQFHVTEQQPRSHDPVRFDGGSDDLTGQSESLGE